MKNQDLYSQGLLTDCTAREHERHMSKYLADLKATEAAREGQGPGQGSHYKPTQTAAEDFFVPNLTMNKALPESVGGVTLQQQQQLHDHCFSSQWAHTQGQT